MYLYTYAPICICPRLGRDETMSFCHNWSHYGFIFNRIINLVLNEFTPLMHVAKNLGSDPTIIGIRFAIYCSLDFWPIDKSKICHMTFLGHSDWSKSRQDSVMQIRFFMRSGPVKELRIQVFVSADAGAKPVEPSSRKKRLCIILILLGAIAALAALVPGIFYTISCDVSKIHAGAGRHSTEVAFMLCTQVARVRLSAPDIFLSDYEMKWQLHCLDSGQCLK